MTKTTKTEITAEPGKQEIVIKKGNYMPKITPFLWFDDQAEEAVNFYTSIFKNAQIGNVTRYGEAGAEVSGRPKGTVMT